MSDFKSSFACDLSNMIELKVSLGGSVSTYLPRATAFDAFCFAKYPNTDGLSKGLALDWLKESMSSGNRVVNSNAAFLRGFAFYLSSIGKEAYRIPDRFMTGKDVFVPYIFTDAELHSIFSAIHCHQTWMYESLGVQCKQVFMRVVILIWVEQSHIFVSRVIETENNPSKGISNRPVYNHAPMLAWYHGKFYLEYLSSPADEHEIPGHTLLTTSENGMDWSIPK